MQSLTTGSAQQALADGIHYIHGATVHGDVAEFGCFQGASAKVLAHAMQVIGNGFAATDTKAGITPRKLWLFDSFKGLPDATAAPDVESPHVRDGIWRWQVKDGEGPTPETMRSICGAHLPNNRIEVVAGWYKDTLASIPAGTKFALVHIDCDLYESTVQVLTHLRTNDMFSDGCALYFDDWYCNRGSPNFGEQAAFSDVYPGNVTDWGAYGVFGRRFIVNR